MDEFAFGVDTMKKSGVYACASRDVGLMLYEILAMTDLMRDCYVQEDIEGLEKQLSYLMSKSADFYAQVCTINALAQHEMARTNKIICENIDIIALTQEIIHMARLIVGNKPVKVMDVSASASLFVYSDRTKIKQIVSSIMSNAAKFTHRGRIALIVSKDGNRIRLTVTDTGIGMTTEQINTFFTSSHEAGLDDVNGTETSNRGLRMVMNLVTDLKGEIFASSKIGEGTIVEVSLPIVSPEKVKCSGAIARPKLLIDCNNTV